MLALAALAGLQQALRSEVLARTPHLEVELPAGHQVASAAARLRRLAGVTGVEEVVRGRGWLRYRDLVQPVEVVGFSGAVPAFFPGVAGGSSGLYVSDNLAARWALERGDVLQVVSPRPTLSPFGPQPRVRSIALAGTFASGRTEEQERVAVPLALAAPLVGGGKVFLELATSDLDRALELAPRVRAVVPQGAVVQTWRELNRPLFFALRLEKTVMFVAVSLIVLVASFALVADLALVISSKRSELGMLGTMGATPARLRSAFLQLGALLGVIGMSAGALVGAVAAWVLDRYRLVHLPNDTFFLDYLPFRVQPQDLVAVLGMTLLLALGSSLFVAQRVGRLRPVEALRQ